MSFLLADGGQEVFYIFSLEMCFKLSLLAKFNLLPNDSLGKGEGRGGAGWGSSGKWFMTKYLSVEFSPCLGLGGSHGGR